MNVTNIITIVLAGILTENMVLAKFLGICPFLGVSKKTNTAVSMGIAVTLVMLLCKFPYRLNESLDIWLA